MLFVRVNVVAVYDKDVKCMVFFGGNFFISGVSYILL